MSVLNGCVCSFARLTTLFFLREHSDFLARSKPLVLFENLTYVHPASGSAVLRLDKLQDFTVAALSRYVAHLNEARSVDNPAPGAEQDAADEASEDFNVAGPL